MNVLLLKTPDYTDQCRRLIASASVFDPVIEQRAREIIQAVRERGDAAISELVERFDGAKLEPDQFAVSHSELMAASLRADESLRAAVAEASANIEAFAQRSLRRGWTMRNSHGATVGEKFDPFFRVGIYVPGGMAPLVSTALMTIPLARVAGCRQIVVCTPCDRHGQLNPALLYAARRAGATEIYRIGGVQAIAALALGTKTIRPVQKIFGPGNAYVVAAKRLLYGYAAMDLLPGPSELLVLADDTAKAAFIAADLLAQAEHGSGHERVWLVTPSLQLLRGVQKEIARQLPGLARRQLIERALRNNGWLIQVAGLAQGVELANRLAPEHLEIICRHGADLAEKITTAGAIFLGGDSPTVLGDYVAGPSHTLPAGGTGASFAGLTVDQFQRRTSLVEYKKPALKKALKTVQEFAQWEGLDAHGRSAEIRFRKR
ncbi:MAG TPA: histidinol dehydrogenase [Candidatus Acidoferrum sp.]|nr:histidinol dehydrogenase [Candidatus Acidoferrum sp.]